MQNKPNFLDNQMNITFYLTGYYKQKPPLRSPPKQTQSNPNKPNFTPVFDPKIGFIHNKPSGNFLNKPGGLQPYSRKNSLWWFFSDMVQYHL
jgi:hypothetical protein